MPPADRTSLWDAIGSAANVPGRFLCGVNARVALEDLVRASSLGGRSEELRGRSVLVATTDQLAAALALIELDGVARRLVLCPPDMPLEHVRFVAASTDVEAIVSDKPSLGDGFPGIRSIIPCSTKLVSADCDRSIRQATEWVLLTSGTTGMPKMVAHTLSSLAGAIKLGGAAADPPVWSTFYDIRRYGGLQIFLRALFTGGSLVLSSAGEPAAAFLTRAGAHGVTHISGTPTHWRHALMSPSASRITPQYVRLSGEIADQAIIGHLRSFYPQAKVAHAFASTEAGVAFEVNDGLAGFPAGIIGRAGSDVASSDVEMKVEDGSLRIRSARTAAHYIGRQTVSLKDADNFVDTGDMLELRGDRYYFAGRRDGVVNVGGLKVHPEEVEAVINRHPRVHMSLVRTRKNPITGALVVADIVLEKEPGAAAGQVDGLQHEILQLCRNTLPRHKVPAVINFVPALTVAATGKIARPHA
jgi:acyl-coenzyme A synthetase/AMP-(fatty) acid ligase